MSNYRASFLKTTALAIIVATLSLLLAIVVLSSLGQTFTARSFSLLLSLLCLAFASLGALVALGGIISLRRDALERAGRPYFSGRPRERSPGFVTRLRRRVLSLLPGSRSQLGLWPGEWARVRPFPEIAATLDENGCLDGLPIMPEMLPYCGARLRVFRRIDKFHDYFTPGGTGMRRVRDAVALGELRCNGGGHGGCQAGCLFTWKEAWLEPANGPEASAPPPAIRASRLEEFACRTSPEGVTRYSCQLTELPRAAALMWWNDPRHYLRSLWSGNVQFVPFVKAVALALFNLAQTKTRSPTAPHQEDGIPQTGVKPPLNLRPGDIVRVKSKEEIAKTLKKSRNRGLSFDGVEMNRFCGGEFRVAKRVETIVDEASGRMLTMKSPCIVLEGVTSGGEYRGLYPQNELIFWREVWLERVGEAPEVAFHAAEASV
ncbi:MAG: hypothetical protein WA579_06210 [Rhodomicrobium sp.]